ncbi:alpha/beta hydrolase [Cupriavidus cauae]|uniref:Alpha/beta hydrolase n=1 Tax=Cupriavidus cauae TaxID=2608999 RepID=A0A5M8ALF4_9BURK|nr:alpha/beta hydrolase [Cupriavidus cauae]KAA6122955.1 alpha/beta hydrolase [Cupriavidus cauae]
MTEAFHAAQSAAESSADAPIEIETAPQPRFAVIWMHGLGADGGDFVPVVPELGLPSDAAVRFIFPHAPLIPVTCNGGYIMRAWYDIVSLNDARRHADESGIRASRDTIRALIARENARGIPSSHIVLAGFSQGGAMAYLAGLTHPEPLAGIIALSTYLASPTLLDAEAAPANAATPIFAAHGAQDDVVPLALGTQARDLLQQRGYPLTWQTYPMPHSVCLEEIADIGVWLGQRLAAAGAGSAA